ncbi:MAG TPA: CHASE2 domain-containing protein, partial [Solirubrobacterales bacterium]
MKSAVQGRTYAFLLIAVAVASAGIALLLYATGLFEDTERSSVDSRFSIRGDQKPRDDIVLVLIDDTTSRELPVRFPFPRSLHAQVINAINRDGAKAIAYDVEFLQPTKPAEDNALINAVANAGPNKVVLADSQPDPQGRSGVFGGQQTLDQIGARAGNDQIGEDPDAVRRRIPFSVGHMETLPLVAAEVAAGKPITTADMGGDTAWIDYAGPPDTYPAVPFSRVLNGQVQPGFFKDKIVVVGASDPTLKDVVDTPTSGSDNLMSGSEVNANAIATALDGFPLQSTPLALDMFLITLMGILAPL